MNQLLFDRSTGNLSPQAFTRHQTSQLIHTIQPTPRLRFNGGEREVAPDNDTAEGREPQGVVAAEAKIWAHQAGVNALSIDIESRM